MSWKADLLKIICEDKETDFALFNKLIRRELPQKVYRYRPPSENSFSALEEGYEYLASPDEYNDPFDARLFFNEAEVKRYAFNHFLWAKLNVESKALYYKLSDNKEFDLNGSYLDEEIEMLSRKKHRRVLSKYKKLIAAVDAIRSSIPRNMVEDINEYLRKDILFCSFTTKSDNELMWSHYALSHKGFCLEYKDYEFDNGLPSLFVPCVYRDSPLYVTQGLKASVVNSKGSEKTVLASAMVKSKVWEYEDEWRYCYKPLKGEKKTDEFKVNRVLVGCNANEATLKRLNKICKRKGVPLVRMKRSSHSFQIVEC